MSLVSSDMNQSVSRPERLPSHCLTATTEKVMTVKSDKPKVAELKNGKVIFRQKPVTLDNHSETMQEIVTFRGLIEASEVPLNDIPNQHLPLIAKLVHESDKTLSALTKSLQSSLVPPILVASQESEPAHASTFLPASSIEHAIKSVADRMNYGIVVDGDKVPATLCVWRWEVKNLDWLPKSVADQAAARVQERIAAKEHLQSVFDDLSSEDRETILKTVKQPKILKGKDAVLANYLAERQIPHSSNPEHEGEDSESGSKKVGRPKKAVDPESAAKEKEKQEKKAVKAEKEKKAVEATKRSAAAFVNFFKPPANSSKPPNSHTSTTAQAVSSTIISKDLNEFQATFKPFVLKKDSQLAPVNWFIDQRKRGLKVRPGITGKTNLSAIIELDADGREVATGESQSDPIAVNSRDDDVATLSVKGMLHSFLASETPSLSSASLHGRSLKPPKSQPLFCVRDVMNQLVEAEVQGDQRAVRRLNGILKNRRKLPVKVFIFAENNRPGYLGTWTRYSPTVGPRTPFARDILSLDYDHDSDAEWEEEEGGEDVESHDESLEDDASSVGSDMEDWLIESDEIDVDPTDSSPSRPFPECKTNKRRTPDIRESPNKRRRVVPLIPFQKGPIWEKEIGCCDYEPFRQMGIQPLNEMFFPIDPFKYVSESASLEKKKDVDALFVLPALPGHLLAQSEPSAEDSRGAKRKAVISQPPPKTTFPDAHVPSLFQKIAESNTSSFVVLLDSLYQDLKSLGIKKNALEVKLREVAEKDKTKKSWTLKEDAWTKNGLMKPT